MCVSLADDDFLSEMIFFFFSRMGKDEKLTGLKTIVSVDPRSRRVDTLIVNSDVFNFHICSTSFKPAEHRNLPVAPQRLEAL